MKERLQKLLAQANIASRRASEDLINAGRVRVNGTVAHVGDKADPAADTVEVDGARLNFQIQPHIYIALNKPKQVLSTDQPHRGDDRRTVAALVKRKEHLFSIGRLDADSEGLIVMTNDGDLAQRLSHPRYRHTKTYRVDVLGLPNPETLDKWQRGVSLEDGLTAPCFVEIVKGNVKLTTLRVVMTEGKKRQIRRIAALLGHPVRKLTRTQIGMYALGDLEVGQTRELTAKDVIALSTPAPEIKEIRGAQSRRRSSAKPEAEAPETKTQPRTSRSKAKDEAPVAEEGQNKRRTPRAKTSDAVAETPKKRTIRRSRNDAHDDKWGKPSDSRKRKPSKSKDHKSSGSKDRKPSSRKDRSS